ncbi:hypothetical protein N665_5291s0003 [Sinapis alba]|nr:hypothetical protein N665_5291s0003 [Sinapis alba]
MKSLSSFSSPKIAAFAIPLYVLYKDLKYLQHLHPSFLLPFIPEMSSSIVVDLGVATIKTTVTGEINEINHLVKTFLSNNSDRKKIIGLDTERAMKPGKQNKTVLLQLCDGDYCLIVQLPPYEYVELPISLFNFLNLPDFTFVGVGINKSLKMLESEFGFTCKNAVDIGPASWNLMTNKAAANLCCKMGDIFPTQKPTSPVFDDWCTSALTKDQIKLAVSNAYLAFGSGNLLLSGFKVY